MASDISALRVCGLTRRYGARMALDALDLDVQPGDLYGFLGPNGAGKTTAIRCILGLIQADDGTVSIFGETDPVRRRAQVGAMVETPAFHAWLSGRMNLELACGWAGFPLADTAAAVEEALTRTGLADRADEPVRGYSLGMKQRLGIARALVTRPKLLVLDEPTNGLDPRGMREVRDLLEELVRRDRITVFVSSHLLAEVEAMCTRVGILDAGKLTAEGRVSELLAGSAVRGGAAERVAVRVDDPVRARGVLEGLAGVEIVEDDGSGAFQLRLRGASAMAVNRALVIGEVGVRALVPHEETLEDVYLSVTKKGGAT